VEAAQFAGDRGMFLGRMRRDPRPPMHRLAVGPVVRLEGDRVGGIERVGGEPVERDPGGAWNEKTWASGSAATTRSGARSPRITASPARVVS
jgi:hypothetical protein